MAAVLTVAELVKTLQEMPQELDAWVEGCDCFGRAVGARVVKQGRTEDGKNYVLIERDGG